jgi:fused signal recognition particle receptor
MEEMKKIRRVLGREIDGAPHETLLVLDATTGQNALVQARLFQEAVAIDGIILTKLDGTARGGMAVAIAAELQVPVRYIGVGEGVKDLRPFDPEMFVDALFENR